MDKKFRGYEMKLDKQDIQSQKLVGSTLHKGNPAEIFHITTKGGLHVILKKTQGGDLQILATANHRAYAREQASSLDKNIQWHENLWKSEDLSKTQAPSNNDSTPQKHYDLAAHFSKLAGKEREKEAQIRAQDPFSVHAVERKLDNAIYSSIAHRHYQMSGLNHKQALEEHSKQMNLHNELQEGAKPPSNHADLEVSWQKANPEKRVSSPFDAPKKFIGGK